MKRLVLLSVAAACGLANATELYNNGPVVASGLSVMGPAATTYGYSLNAAEGMELSDDFTVGAGATWNVASLDFFAFQRGAVGFTVTDAIWSIVSGNVNTGTVIASGTAAVTNGGLQGYRVTSTNLGNHQNAIYKIQVDVTDFVLTEGHYWLRWCMNDPGYYGPWQPPTSDARQGNAQRKFSGGTYNTLIEDGSGLTIELPFAINSVTPVPEPSSTMLMLAGGLAMAGLVRRRRKQD